MDIFKGKSIFGGTVIGKISIYQKREVLVKRLEINDTEKEISRFRTAKEQTKSELVALYDKALSELGEENALIFHVHQMMLDDIDYVESVMRIIENEQVNAEYAVMCTGDNFSNMFKVMDDDYMRARAADVKDVSDRLIRVLQENVNPRGANRIFEEQGSNGYFDSEASIILAEDLTPSEIVTLDKEKVLAFVTKGGSTNSHTAILARTMNIPAVIGIDFSEEYNRKIAIVDGNESLLIVEPDELTITKYRENIKRDKERKEYLEKLKGEKNVTLDGTEVLLYANIGSVSDVKSVLQNDAGGIGLFRSEFLYLESKDYPSEEEQFNAYMTVVREMAGRRVIIRTLDIGADKQVDYFGMEKEENPAMGYRSIRMCLDRVELFKTQLRAIYRASAFGNVSIMFPMIISIDEVRRIKDIVKEVKEELDNEKLSYGNVELGIMIETPAAVMISDLLAKEVDFFSIGTNDLTQFTLAIDRQNSKLDAIYDSHHEAILRMIRMVVENGHREGCAVGICGELAADTALTEEFLRMGIDELSVAPGMVLTIRDKIRNINLKA